MDKVKVPYSDKLDADEQISTEEEIASHLFDILQPVCLRLPTDTINELSKDVLYIALRRFRPDLFDKTVFVTAIGNGESLTFEKAEDILEDEVYGTLEAAKASFEEPKAVWVQDGRLWLGSIRQPKPTLIIKEIPIK